MEFVNVSTQAELDKALEQDGVIPVVVGNGSFAIRSGSPEIHIGESSSPSMEAWESSSPSMVARGSSSPRMVARGSSSPSMVARGSSSPRMEAWESSSPSMVARGSSSPSMVAWESSSPSMEAWESSSPSMEARGSSSPRMVARGSSSPRMEAWESSSVTGRVGKYALVGVINHGATVDIPGAVLLRTPESIETVDEWIDYYGCELKRGRVVVFKNVHDNFRSDHQTLYAIGGESKCDDWLPTAECGNGLHFSPSASATDRYSNGTRYLACSVRVKDVVLLGDKLKAPSCRVLYEVDRNGEQLVEKAAA